MNYTDAKSPHESVALIALGANLPTHHAKADATLCKTNVGETLRKTLAILHKVNGITISTISRFYRTPAFPKNSGPDYINAAMLVKTRLTPESLLAQLHQVEAGFGRDRSAERWAARTLDLDLLAYDNLVMPTPECQLRWMQLPPDEQRVQTPQQLILPHPRMHERGFVLVPLADTAPLWRHPVTGETVRQMLDRLPPAERAEISPYSGSLP